MRRTTRATSSRSQIDTRNDRKCISNPWNLKFWTERRSPSLFTFDSINDFCNVSPHLHRQHKFNRLMHQLWILSSPSHWWEWYQWLPCLTHPSSEWKICCQLSGTNANGLNHAFISAFVCPGSSLSQKGSSTLESFITCLLLRLSWLDDNQMNVALKTLKVLFQFQSIHCSSRSAPL